MVKLVTLIAGVAILVGAYRSLVSGDQGHARGLLIFGGIVFLTNVSFWIAERRGEDGY
jgi:hypothetical protein